MHAFAESLSTAITVTIIVIVAIIVNKSPAVAEERVPLGTLQGSWWLKAVSFPGNCISQVTLPEAKMNNLQAMLFPQNLIRAPQVSFWIHPG